MYIKYVNNLFLTYSLYIYTYIYAIVILGTIHTYKSDSQGTKALRLPRSSKMFKKIVKIYLSCRERPPQPITANSRKGKKRHKEEKLQLAAIQPSAVKCYYKRRDLYEHCEPSQKAHIDGSSARILSNDFTFTPWLSTLATF